jgi:hypothetical protein
VSSRLESWYRPAERPGGLAVAAAVAAFVLSWALLHHGFYTRDQILDTPVYQTYGDWMADGRIPYRDFRPEYPPLALPVFVIPSVVAGTHEEQSYRRAFEALMLLCGVALVLAAASALAALRADAPRALAALAFAALSPLVVGSVVLSRFDLWPAALTALALAALLHGRSRLGAGLLGAAVAAKLYPAVLVPLVAVWLWRREGRRSALMAAAVFVAVLAACFVPFLVIAPEGVVVSLRGQLSRPLQIETLGAALLLAAKHLFGLHVAMESSHGSQNIAGTAGVVVGWVQTVVQATVLVWIWVEFARGRIRPERLVRFTAAAVVAFIALGKVLSPQFLIWLCALVPLVYGRRGALAAGALGVAIALTQIWFPFQYWHYVRTLDPTLSWLVLARDGVLVGLLAILVLPARRAGSPAD